MGATGNTDTPSKADEPLREAGRRLEMALPISLADLLRERDVEPALRDSVGATACCAGVEGRSIGGLRSSVSGLLGRGLTALPLADCSVASGLDTGDCRGFRRTLLEREGTFGPATCCLSGLGVRIETARLTSPLRLGTSGAVSGLRAGEVMGVAADDVDEQWSSSFSSGGSGGGVDFVTASFSGMGGETADRRVAAAAVVALLTEEPRCFMLLPRGGRLGKSAFFFGLTVASSWGRSETG